MSKLGSLPDSLRGDDLQGISGLVITLKALMRIC